MSRRLMMDKSGLFLFLDKLEEAILNACDEKAKGNEPLRERVSEIFFNTKRKLVEWEGEGN